MTDNKSTVSLCELTHIEALSEVMRLERALRWEQNWCSRIGTHGPGCYLWGPGHYNCVLDELERVKKKKLTT